MKLLNPFNWSIMENYLAEQISGILSLSRNTFQFDFLLSIIYSCPGIHNLFQYHLVQQGVCLPHTHGEVGIPASTFFTLSPATCWKALLKLQPKPKQYYAMRVAGVCIAHSSTKGLRKTIHNHIFSLFSLLSLFCFVTFKSFVFSGKEIFACFLYK